MSDFGETLVWKDKFDKEEATASSAEIVFSTLT